jgi:hypothetical protein
MDKTFEIHRTKFETLTKIRMLKTEDRRPMPFLES